MARVRKPLPTLDLIFFASPEQKVMKLLLSEPTTTFTPRVISSKLKGVRGLGGSEGIMRILTDLQSLGLVDFVDNNRAVRLHDENSSVHLLKTFLALCELEGVRKLVEPISTRGILFGSRASGRARSDSDYDLFIVSSTPEEVKHTVARHPLGKQIEVICTTPEDYDRMEETDPNLIEKLEAGLVLWGNTW